MAAAVLVGVLTLYFLRGLIFSGGESKQDESGALQDESNFVQRMADQVGRVESHAEKTSGRLLWLADRHG